MGETCVRKKKRRKKTETAQNTNKSNEIGNTRIDIGNADTDKYTGRSLVNILTVKFKFGRLQLYCLTSLSLNSTPAFFNSRAQPCIFKNLKYVVIIPVKA